MSARLPVAPHTLIEISVEQIDRHEDLDVMGLWLRGIEVMYRPGSWWVQFGTGVWLSADDLGSKVSGFTVFAEPRAATAEALLDEVRPWIWGPNVKNLDYWNTELGKLARRYGVES